MFAVWFCRLRNPACNARAIYCHLWPVPLYNIFPIYLLNKGFSKKVIEHKICVLIQHFFKTFLILRRSERDTIKNVYQCNAWRCITGKRWIDIWLVFINLDFEMRFDNFTRATCILYIDLRENLKFLPSQCTKYKLHV